MRTVVCVNGPVVREAVRLALTEVGLDIVGCALDEQSLMLAISDLRPQVVVFVATDTASEAGICDRLLADYPDIKVVVVSGGQYLIADVGTRARRCGEASARSIRESLLTLPGAHSTGRPAVDR